MLQFVSPDQYINELNQTSSTKIPFEQQKAYWLELWLFAVLVFVVTKSQKVSVVSCSVTWLNELQEDWGPQQPTAFQCLRILHLILQFHPEAKQNIPFWFTCIPVLLTYAKDKLFSELKQCPLNRVHCGPQSQYGGQEDGKVLPLWRQISITDNMFSHVIHISFQEKREKKLRTEPFTCNNTKFVIFQSTRNSQKQYMQVRQNKYSTFIYFKYLDTGL